VQLLNNSHINICVELEALYHALTLITKLLRNIVTRIDIVGNKGAVMLAGAIKLATSKTNLPFVVLLVKKFFYLFAVPFSLLLFYCQLHQV